jgi:hypothetical protein
LAPENLPEFPALAVTAVPGLEIRLRNADGDPLGRGQDLKGSVVGIHFEVTGMHTGTLIRDLMATVERAELTVEQKRVVDARELYRIYAMQVPATQADQILMGAA